MDFHGMGVALATPFLHNLEIDDEALRRLVRHVVDGGADYLVALGTTAETPTLTPEERQRVIDTVIAENGGRVPLVIGCGGNDTAALCRHLRDADTTPFSAVLSVVPYYNKPSQEGIYRHYRAVADASPLPLILYNVPGRTGVNMTSETVLRLVNDAPNIAAIKEASGNATQAAEIILRNPRPESFKIISGDDATALPLIRSGASGVISVIGNALPGPFSRMVHLALKGRYDEAAAINDKLNELYKLLFVDGNPAGVKCLLNIMGMCHNQLRLPLVETRLETHDKILAALTTLTDQKILA